MTLELVEQIDPMTGKPRAKRATAKPPVKPGPSPAVTSRTSSPLASEDDSAAVPVPPVAISTPDDVDIPKSGNSFLRTAVDWISGAPKDEAKPKTPRTRRTAKIDDESLDISPDEFASIFLVPLLAFAIKTLEFDKRPNRDEIVNIAKPASRILYRHVKVLKHLGPDVIDGAMIMGVMLAYVDRLGREARERQRPQNIYPHPTMAQESVAQTANDTLPTAEPSTPDTSDLYSYLHIKQG